jgi:hypothetical protein
MRVLAAIVAAGCGGGDASYDYAASKGAPLYQDMCQVCHGETGEGGLGPSLRDTKRSQNELESIIAQTMPANAPGQCTGDCASAVAELIVNGLTTRALRCDAVAPSPRRLRLLTRREYRATIRDLFGDGAPAMTCARQTDCAFRDTCTGGQCQPSACDAQTFAFDPQGHSYRSVHVAGDWNGWPQTIAGGGLALTYANGLWTGTFSIGAGQHAYKLVLDESQWIADPRAPASAPDGFGGMNSIADVSCAPDSDLAAGIPVETRRAGFPFDTDASSALVTAAHVDAYLAAAEKIAKYAAADPNALAACDWSGDRGGCGRALVGDLGLRVFRRPPTQAETDRYTALITGGSDATDGVATALEAMLVSPAFLYRSELGDARDGHYRLNAYEIATALAYTFWGTTPDAALLAAASSGELADPAGLERSARRLVADPRARPQLGEFALQWVGGQNVLTADKRMDLYPDFTDAVRAALADETRNFAADVVFDGSGRFDDLLTAKYTVVDASAAKFYGLSATGRVPDDDRHAGILGHASVLATTAHSDQTSPIQRGLLIRRNLLCEELPPPPPFGGGLPMVDPNATTRERFAMHSTAPACKACHQYIDNVGFGLERFDPVGRWRDSENGKPIDPAGDMNDVERLGTSTSSPFRSLPELAQAIAGSQAAPSCFVRQYLRWSRGLRESLATRCGRLWLEDRFGNRDVKELMVQSVLAPDFVERR